ncbi:hypothetical protein PybrP1_008596 [[Pythium] brassicae (nom. inval.)]|nr:hypothetical protein PybrP1_008596 [[Pythium] brassicae (nom. inval.)]
MRLPWQAVLLCCAALLLLPLRRCSGASPALSLATAWYQSTRCNEASTTAACSSYERCKTTHRCARGDEGEPTRKLPLLWVLTLAVQTDYSIAAATHASFTRQFAGGSRLAIPLSNDFEDWKTGTHRWKLNQATNALTTAKVGWNTFDFDVIGSLELSAGYLVFDTDAAELRGDVVLRGVMSETAQGTQVAVFNFLTVYLGKDVRVRFVGGAAVSIMSRSSMVVDTELQVRAGTLGGFPGGGFVGAGAANNNRNGPGSSSVRVYVKTLSTFGTHVPEIQEIETSAAAGQKIQGHFVLLYGDDDSVETQPIAYDATSYDVQKALEIAFPDIGSLSVQRDDTAEQVPESGRLWRVTFLTAVGDAPQLRATSHLKALSSKVVTRTVRDGNQLSGTFRLELLGNQTRALPHDVSSETLRAALLEDFPHLVDVRVARTDPLSQCIQGSTKPEQSATTLTSPTAAATAENSFDPSHWMVPNERLGDSLDSVKNYPDKLCASGRGAADGYVWKLQFWTREGNQMPLSPTSSTAQLVDAAAILTVDFRDLQGIGATAEVVDSLAFSLAFGGAGASFASRGGEGYSQPHRVPRSYAQTYSDDRVSDLLGGSGGAGGGLDPIDVFPIVQPTLGGAGAGALMLSAVNDLLIGNNGKISVNGGHGRPGFTAGGGGSGGTLLLVSGGSVSHHGAIEALGGFGGSSSAQNNNLNPANPGGGGSGGRVAIYAQSYSPWGVGSILLTGGASQDPTRAGGKGSLFVHVQTNLAIRVDPTVGAAGTFKSLLVDGSEDYDSGSHGVVRSQSHQVSRSGPRFVLDAPSRPTRVSYFVRIGNFARGKVTTNRGAIFGVHGSSSGGDNKDEFMIAVAIVDGSFTHEANAFQWPRRAFQHKVQPDRWYKVDLLLDWSRHTYSIHLNDVLKVQNVDFLGERVDSLSLNNLHAMSTWWDELYVGENHLMGFACPYVAASPSSPTSYNRNQQYGDGNGVVVVKKRGLCKLWAASYQTPDTTYHPMTRHESHLSAREVFKRNNGSIVPLDGEPHRAFLNDIREPESESPDGSGEEDLESVEILSQAEMLVIPGLPQDSTIVLPLETGVDFATLAADRSSSTRANALSRRMSVYWYSEVYDESSLVGGVGACSTLDYLEWRNEGIMVHFANLTDPFGHAAGDLLADRPKVLYNSKSSTFVMWMHVDNRANTMGLSGVATSAYPNGPFSFERSFYPDGAPLEAPGGQSINETHDQTIALVAPPSGQSGAQPQAFLLRAYYKTVEYWLPRAVMDPLWQSVQTAANKTDFGLSYHRAFYHSGYDNPNDIYLQRWRMEDAPWQLVCCEPTNATHCVSYTQLPSSSNETCPAGMEKKQILGQSQMTGDANHIASRYKDPNDDASSFFLPRSVRSHTPWGFQVYNVKTWRGNYFDALSTNITRFIFKRFAGERRRLEIERDRQAQFEYPNEEELACDSIPTNDTEVLNLLLGTLGVPVSTAFASNHSSYDLLEIDVNSDGTITSSEIAQLKQKGAKKKLTAELVASLLDDFDAMKRQQVARLDADRDGAITFPEFEAWVGLDTNLLFDRFDLDKNGYLDENELARTMWHRQMPRLDAVMILLDPSFDGRVYYQRFRALVREAPGYVFKAYDFDGSGTLTQNEIDLMIKDLGPAFADPAVFNALKNATTHSITKADYATWFSSSTSLLADARNQLKVDNAVHATRPDSLTGPLHVVEQRRAKFVAINRLTGDYLGTEGLLREVEGDFEGREALMNYFEFAEQLFGLSDDDVRADLSNSPGGAQPFRAFLSSEMLHDRASYWNGRHWEGRPSAPPLFTYGPQCTQVAGVDARDSLNGCLPCLTRSPYVTSAVDAFQTQTRSADHCRPQKELDAYIKEFDQQVSIQLQYQQQAVYGPQGLQPHLSPCFNQSQFFPCDVHKVLDGNVADALRGVHTRETQWQLAWERHPNNVGSSVKVCADDLQRESRGPSFTERFPNRLREPFTSQTLDTIATSSPDELADVLGGGS